MHASTPPGCRPPAPPSATTASCASTISLATSPTGDQPLVLARTGVQQLALGLLALAGARRLTSHSTRNAARLLRKELAAELFCRLGVASRQLLPSRLSGFRLTPELLACEREHCRPVLESSLRCEQQCMENSFAWRGRSAVDCGPAYPSAVAVMIIATAATRAAVTRVL